MNTAHQPAFQRHSAVNHPLWDFAQELQRDQRQVFLAEANAEVDHRMTPESLEDYANTLERAQRKIGFRPFNPPEGNEF